MMKRYVIRRTADGTVTCHVRVNDQPERPLRHLVRHSPTGFEYGYHGSGPADLARSIVGDLLAEDDPAPSDYQAVKAAFIGTLDRDHPGPHELTEDQVYLFLLTLPGPGRPGERTS